MKKFDETIREQNKRLKLENEYMLMIIGMVMATQADKYIEERLQEKAPDLLELWHELWGAFAPASKMFRTGTRPAPVADDTPHQATKDQLRDTETEPVADHTPES